MKTYIFTYGSMKQNFRNHGILQNDIFKGAATTKNKYVIYPASSFNYPYAVESEKKYHLKGELYEITKTDIETIDDFEGSPHYYYRKLIKVKFNNSIVDAFMYFRTNPNPVGMEIEIPLCEWTKDFEEVGIRQELFLDSLRIAIKNINNC